MLKSLPPLESGRLRRGDRFDHPRLFELRKRFERVSKRTEQHTSWRRNRSYAANLLMLSAITFWIGSSVYPLAEKWPIGTVLKHIAAAPNCDAARAVGLAPALRGQPGYYDRHDADNDGTACEPYPR